MQSNVSMEVDFQVPWCGDCQVGKSKPCQLNVDKGCQIATKYRIVSLIKLNI